MNNVTLESLVQPENMLPKQLFANMKALSHGAVVSEVQLENIF